MIHTKETKLIFFACLFILFVGALLPILYVLFKAIVSSGNLFALSQAFMTGNRQWSLLKNTLSISLGTSIGSIFLGAPLAFFLSRVSFPGRSLFLLIFPISLLIPPYVHTICWSHVLESYGWISKLLPTPGPSPGDKNGLLLSIWIMVLAYYPIVTLLSYIGFSQMDANLEDAGRIQAGATRVSRCITWKLARPAILSGGLFVFIFALSNFGVPSMLGVQVYSLEVFYQFSTLHRMDQAAVFALPLLFLSLSALFGINRFEKDPRFTIETSTRKCRPFVLDKGKWLVSGLILFLHALSVFLPIKVLLEMAGPWENYLAAISNARHDILVSFWTSAAAASFTLTIGGILAFMVWSIRTKVGSWLEKICILSFAFPAVGVGIGIIGLWNREGLFQWVYSSILILIIAYFCRYVSFAFKPVRIAMSYIDFSVNESAQVIGIPWWQRLSRLLAPISIKGLMVSWFFVYLFSITDLGMAILVHPPGKGTMPIRIFNLLHFGRQEWVGALCLVLIALVILPYSILILWDRKEKYGSSS